MKKENKRKLFTGFKGVSKAEWTQKVEKDLKGKPFEKLNWRTYEGFEVPPFFTRKDINTKAGINSLPGELPFRRGNAMNMLNGTWQMVQEISVDNSKEAVARMSEARKSDIHAFKLYSWQGGAKGKDFLPVVREMDLSQEALHLYASYEPLKLVDGINRILDIQGTDRSKLTGTMTSLAIDTGRVSREAVLKLMDGSPHFRCLGIDLSMVDENGGSQVHQLAFALSRTVDWVCQTPVDPQRIFQALNFTFPVGSDFMMEVAKLRAFRILFAYVAEKLGGKGAALSPFVLAQSARWNKSRYDVHTNLLRTTTEAMSAVMGGAHAVSISAFDKLMGPESAFSARMARNIQHLLKHESYLDQVADPAGGSYYVEQLTNSLVEQAWKCFQEIEDQGGYEACLLSGSIDQMLVDSQLKKQTDIASRKRVFVGINNYPNTEEELSARLNPDEMGDEGPALFEKIRLKTDRWAQQNEKRPSAFLLTFGDIRMRNARMQFARNLLGCAGFLIETNNPGAELDVSLAAMKSSEPEVVILCAADKDYNSKMLSNVRKALPQATVVVAGKPEKELKVDGQIYAGMDAINFLEDLFEKVTA
jgi:methylmalonyl-CoA mutase